MQNYIEIGGVYRHYKNKKLYRVLSIAKHTETNEDMVVYVALYGKGQIWTRPLSMWNEKVELDGREFLRFTKIDE